VVLSGFRVLAFPMLSYWVDLYANQVDSLARQPCPCGNKKATGETHAYG
jgi:hypothetical protein